MDLSTTVPLEFPAAAVLAEVSDLGGYPAWLGLVRGCAPTGGAPGDGGPAWAVDLGAGVGPWRRTKRVRMVRVENGPRIVRFVRIETDQRSHSSWVLTAEVESVDAPGAPAPSGSARTRLTMHLHYGGMPLLLVDQLLGAEIRRAGARLGERLADGSATTSQMAPRLAIEKG